jgi:hypothetical protein
MQADDLIVIAEDEGEEKLTETRGPRVSESFEMESERVEEDADLQYLS